MLIDSTDPQIENKLLAQERIYDQLRHSGELAQASILRFTDTGIRIGDNATMMQFGLLVYPSGGRPAFNAESQTAVSDASRPKFVTDSTIYVRFNPADLTQVAIDHIAVTGPKTTVLICPTCGASQTLSEGQAACSFCGAPLPTITNHS
jgi:hypothetical protein